MAIGSPPTQKISKGKKKSVSVSSIQAESDHSGKTCSICSTSISQGEVIIACPCCKLPFHEECWKEIGGCGTYGCDAAPDVPKTETARGDEFQSGWVAQKICPECKTQINASALKCKVCHASFPTEKPMTQKEYLDREYDGKEFLKMRNLIIANFIFSAIGCLCFLSIPMNFIHLLSDQGMFRVVRLPPTLKFLFYASTGISCLWGVIVLIFLVFSR